MPPLKVTQIQYDRLTAHMAQCALNSNGHTMKKMHPKTITAIKKMISQNKSQKHISNMLGVSTSTIQKVKHGWYDER